MNGEIFELSFNVGEVGLVVGRGSGGGGGGGGGA